MPLSIDIEIDSKFKSSIPALSQEERQQLEQNIIDHGGARDPLIVWQEKNILVDGHNRYEICTRLNLPYEIKAVSFDSREKVCDWIDANQLGRRNLSPDAFRLLLGRRYNRMKKTETNPNGRNQHSEAGGQFVHQPKTAERIAAEHGVDEKTVRRAGKFAEEVEQTPELQQAINDRVPVAKITREIKRKSIIEDLESIEKKTSKKLAGEFDVLVIDPPWPMKKIERDVAPNQVELDYPTMSEADLAAMHLPMAQNCHVWVWCTHKFIPMAFRLFESWKLNYVCTFVWHKPGGFQPFNLPQYNCEFAFYCRKGTPEFIDTKAFPVCFTAPRGKHSEKPEEFYDVVRRVTAGRRADIFNRRKIEGFESYGNEAE